MIRKDIQLATRNIGSAFMFAIPVFVVVILYPMIQNWGDGILRSYPALVAVEYANLFGGISLVSSLMFDTQGASIHEGLPLSSRMTLKSKTAIVAVPYALSLIALDIVFFISAPISPLILLMPIIQIPCGYALGMTVGAAIFKIRGGGRAVAVKVTNDQAIGIIAGAVAAGVGIIPLMGYGIAMIATGLHVVSLAAQGLAILFLVLIARYQVPKLLKD
jgi:predicted permease